LHGGRGRNPYRLVFPAFDVQLPATNITAANTITTIALANCVTSLILLHQISPMHAGIRQGER